MELLLSELGSPLGDLLIAFQADTLYALDYGDRRERLEQGLRSRWPDLSLEPAALPRSLARPIEHYFVGDWQSIYTLALDPGGTPFQQRVWHQLRQILPGQVISYGHLAQQLGCPGGAQAVGAANGRNPIAIAIPCHRVIGRNGDLTGYAGGLERKSWLLTHERASFQAAGSQASDCQQLDLFSQPFLEGSRSNCPPKDKSSYSANRWFHPDPA